MVEAFVGTGVMEFILASKFITPLWTTTGEKGNGNWLVY